jgi:hypothetical protein
MVNKLAVAKRLAIRCGTPMELNELRELALHFRALADHGTEGELRAELKRLSAELAAWIVNREIQTMTGEDSL